MSLFSSLQVSASGMAAQRTRAELLVENMANADTTRTPQGGPYRRKDVVFSSGVQSSPFSSTFQNELSTGSGPLPTSSPTTGLPNCVICPAIRTPMPTVTSPFRI